MIFTHGSFRFHAEGIALKLLLAFLGGPAATEHQLNPVFRAYGHHKGAVIFNMAYKLTGERIHIPIRTR